MSKVLTDSLTNEEQATLADLNNEKLGFFNRLFSKCFSIDTVNSIMNTYNAIIKRKEVETSIQKQNCDNNISELLKQIADLKNSYVKTITDLEKDLKKCNKSLTTAMGDVVSIRKEKHELSSEYNNAMKSLRSKHADTLRKVYADHAAEIIKLDKKYTNLESKLNLKTKDVTVKKKSKKTGVPKLTCDQIKNARTKIANGVNTIGDIASEYGVSNSTLSRAINGITYKKCLDNKEL